MVNLDHHIKKAHDGSAVGLRIPEEAKTIKRRA